MFRIRCVHDAFLPINRNAIAQVQDIIRLQFSDVMAPEILALPEKLLNPMKYNFRSVLYVWDDRKGQVKGFALFSAEPTLGFGFLDLIALSSSSKGGGVGAALYQRVQEECASHGFDWLFFESMTDLKQDYPDTKKLKENKARMRFYESIGARPVMGTDYELPRKANDGNAYYLMDDDEHHGASLDSDRAQRV